MDRADGLSLRRCVLQLLRLIWDVVVAWIGWCSHLTAGLLLLHRPVGPVSLYAGRSLTHKTSRTRAVRSGREGDCQEFRRAAF